VSASDQADRVAAEDPRWLTPGVRGIGAASFLADVGHEVPTALLPAFLTATLGAPAAALGLIEGISDGLAGTARLAGGALADDPQRRRAAAVGGYTVGGDSWHQHASACCRLWRRRSRGACCVDHA